MKNALRLKSLTFGDLIASLYGACDRRRAAGLLRLAVNAQLLSVPGQRRATIHATRA